MAQFDVHEFGKGLVVNCQSDLLDQLQTRFVVPLVRQNRLPAVAERLNPRVEVAGGEFIMLTQAASAVRTRDLGPLVGSLLPHAFAITGAIDVLLNGV